MKLIISWMDLIFLFWNSYVGFWTGVANSFWNYVIQISSRQMYFQDIYSNLWKVKVFSGNIYYLKSNTYFWGTVMLVQDGFLYLIVIRHKLTVLVSISPTRTSKRIDCIWAASDMRVHVRQFVFDNLFFVEMWARALIYDCNVLTFSLKW